MAEEYAVLDDARAQRFLKEIDSKVTEVAEKRREVVGLLGAVIFRDVMDHFAKESGPQGAWKAWSKAYKAHMTAVGKGGNRLLQDTGRLRGSFQPGNYRVQNDGVLWFNPARTSSGFPYAAHHDETAKTTRPFMWISDPALDELQDVIFKRILGE